MSTSTFHQQKIGDIVHLNVGGTRFSTSWQTLMWVPDSFFTALLSGRIPSLRDETGAIFIDRDPKMFSIILNYLRTKEVDLRDVNIRSLRHESDYFGITPLSRRLALCDEMTHSSCGDVLFYGYLPPPANLTPPMPVCSRPSQTKQPSSSRSDGLPGSRSHSRNSSLDLRLVGRVTTTDQLRCNQGHSRTASLDLRNGSQELPKPIMPRCDVNGWPEHLRVQIIKAHHNWIVVAYSHLVVGYRLTDTCGWGVVFQSPVQEAPIERVALNAKVGGGEVMLGIACSSLIKLWAIASHADPIRRTLVGTFNLGVRVEHLLFIGPQLVALSSSGGRASNGSSSSGNPTNGSNSSINNSGNTGNNNSSSSNNNNNNTGVNSGGSTGGKAGVWHTSTQHWQVQDIAPLTSFDTAGSFLLLGTINGAINYIDMQKFPLRMKDNDLLVTQLYKDPNHEPITAISVYLTPKTSLCGNWIEIAYGTRGGSVRVIVQHPETVGHGPQLFQTFTVHQSPVTKVSLSEKYLVSVCSEYNHVRSWKVTRFRGMISTQPGTTPEASFKILSLEPSDPNVSSANDCGPYGEQDEEQLFVQKVVHETDTLYVRRASDGKRVCIVKSVDGSMVSCFVVMECEGTLRPRRLLLTGHCSGATHMWDLTTALDRLNDPTKDSEQSTGGGPSADELVRLVEHCNLQCTAPSSPHRPLM